MLNGGAVTTGTPIITDTEINIPINSGNLDVVDGGSTVVTIAVYLNTTGIMDGAVFSCFVDADDHGFTAHASGSAFASAFTLGDIISNDFDIEVDASQFVFQVQPSNVVTGATMVPAVVVVAQDVNGNTDLDYNIPIPLTASASVVYAPIATTTVTPVNGVATFDNLIFDAAGVDLSIAASASNDGVFVVEDVTSNTFTVSDPVQIIISRVADPGDNTDGRFVEIKNVGSTDQDISGWKLNVYANGSTSPNSNTIDAGAVLMPGDTYIIGLSSFSSVYGCFQDEVSSLISGNGDDVYALLDGSTVIDILGEIGQDGTGEPWEYTDAQAVRNPGVTLANPTWNASEWTITAADIADISITCSAPANDACASATVLSCGDILTAETTEGASDNGNSTGCNYGKGVWYSFVGNDKEVTIEADGSSYGFDLALSVSSSSDCANFINMDCIDDYFSSTPETYTFFANSGTTYYFYIAYFGDTNGTIGLFDVSLTCVDVSISQQSLGSCFSADDIASTGSGQWVNIYDGAGDIVASILDSESLGLVETDVFINNGAVRTDGTGRPYLDRNISITPTNQPVNPVKVRLYLTSAEFSALEAEDMEINAIDDVNVTKTSVACSSSVTSGGTFIQQNTSGALNVGYYVEVLVPSFSSFFLHAGNNVLPVEMLSFTGVATNAAVHLAFSTATEQNNSHFLIQRSTDGGKTFATIGRVEGKGDSNERVDYEYVDTKPAPGMNYYRLQQFDFDGTTEYFGPVAVRFGQDGDTKPTFWPVPATDRLHVQCPEAAQDWLLQVFDLNGRLLSQESLSDKTLSTSIDVSHFPAGTYLVRWNNGTAQGQERFVKQ
ncbi:MAG: lamin tail domain-containing protein [Saprospiraceae bacterium]